jgi:hypothetical protein
LQNLFPKISVSFEGRYDALNPTLFGYDKNAKAFRYLNQLPQLNGEFRDGKWIDRAGTGKVLALSRNNEELIFLKPSSQ